MKVGIIAGAVILILALGAGYLFVFRAQDGKGDTSNNTKVSWMDSPDDVVVENSKLTINSNLTVGSDSTSVENSGGNYITGMAADGYKNSSADKIVLFFYANWCPTCRPVDAELKQRLTEIPAGIEIYRVNYNDDETDEAEKALAQKYGVTYQHTFVQVDKNGNEITKWNGGGLDNLISKVK